MLIIIDVDSGLPIYRQIVDQVRFQVASGQASPGEELPSTRTLSRELGVNPMTVSKSYRLLEEEGLLERRPGLPLVVADYSERRLRREQATELHDLLVPVATAARQLDIDDEKAVEIFRQVLEAQSVPTEPTVTKEPVP